MVDLFRFVHLYFCFYTLLYARLLKVLGGPKRRNFYKIVGIKVSRTYSLTICVIIFQHKGRIFICYYAIYIYIYIYTYIPLRKATGVVENFYLHVYLLLVFSSTLD